MAGLVGTKDYPIQEQDLIYALDIGTRSVIGMLGQVEDGKVHILHVEKQPHVKRAMMDGQIEDIAQVAGAVSAVTQRLEKAAGCKLSRACVAAAGRALRTEQGHGILELPSVDVISEEQIGQLEADAVSRAEEALHGTGDGTRRLFLVGYTATQYTLDDYPLTNLLGHTGQRLEVDVVATFLPSEVIDSLYAVMRASGLEVASLTLEPIAALNAAIPAELRLLNLALVDIGAGTSDIAICREGSVVGYTMATVAGDEITESLMREYLVDYHTAERIKTELSQEENIVFTDILGLEQSYTSEQIMAVVGGAARNLVSEIAEQILQLNGSAPSALFLAGGGSKLAALREKVAEALGMDARRVALAGAHFKSSAYSDTIELEDPEYTTPLGIAISAGLGLISDSYRVFLNDKPAKLFRSGKLTVLELLMMNGYTYRDLLGKNGKSVVLQIDGKRAVYHGQPAIPAKLLVNGVEAQPSVVIHAGDQIVFVPAQPGEDRTVRAGELMKQLDVEDILVNGMELHPDQELASGEQIRTRAKPAPAPAPAVVAAAAPPPQEEEEKTEQKPQEQYRFYLNEQPLILPAKPDKNPYYLMDLLEYSGIDFKHLDRPVRLRVNGRACTFQQVLHKEDQVEIRYEE